MKLADIKPKLHHNYVAFFLTLSCNLRCPYCINLHNGNSRSEQVKGKGMSADEWIRATNRLVLREDLPLTLQGGEPTLYPGFYRLVNEVREDLQMDLMTNMMFDAAEFIRKVPRWRFSRKAPYAAIRVSYHPGQNHIEDLIRKTLLLQEAGFRVGLYGIEHPDETLRAHIFEIRDRCLSLGLDFRTKEFLGEHEGKLHGTFKYDGCVNRMPIKSCECRTTELIVGPGGNVHRCHADLYQGRRPIAHILDEGFTEDELDRFRVCDFYGDCNPCDVKVKTNRFQVFGHTSVEIRNIPKGTHGQLPAGRS